MPIGLTHLGEAIVQMLIEAQPNRFLELCGLPQLGVHGSRVFREVELLPYAGKRFDGASRIDLIVPLNAVEALPVEVKLGETRLSKRRVDSEWLSGCRASHDGTRWAGNMMSILDQLVPTHAPEERLIAHANGTDFPLTHSWCVVVRRRTANAWSGPERPAFSRATVVAFDDLVAAFEPEQFDEMIRRLLTFPYHQTWVGGG
jgi:hypothetical protein